MTVAGLEHFAGAALGRNVDVVLEAPVSDGECTALLDVDELGVCECEECEERVELLDLARWTMWDCGCEPELGLLLGLVKVNV